MKKVLIFSALFLLASVSLSAQVVKGAGLWYFNGLPNVTPSVATGTEVAYSINNKALFKWNRTTSTWVSVVQDSSITNELQDLILSGDTLSLTLSDSIVLMGQYRNRIWEITNLSDTTSITTEIEGDVAYTSTGDTIAFRSSTAWLPFTGGGGGGTFNSFNIAGDTGSSIVTDGQTVTVAGGYGINTAETGGTVTVTADTTQLVTPFDISTLMTNWLLGGTSGTPQTVSNGQTATVAAGTGITTTAGATRTVTVAIANTGISAATYGSASQVPVFAVNAQGQLTTATNTAIQIAISQVTGLSDSLSSHPSGTGTNLRIPVWTGTNSLGSSTLLQSATGLTLDANLAFRLTGGTTASRPTGAAGMTYYNTSNNWFDLHNGTSWFNPLRSATATGLGTAGRVFYAGASGTAAADDNLSWDATNDYLGIGTTTPLITIHGVSGSTGFGFAAGTIGALNGANFIVANPTISSVTGKSLFLTAENTIFRTTSNAGVGIGTINSEFTPAGRLELRGRGSTSATQNSLFRNSVGSPIFAIRDDGRVAVGNEAPANLFEVEGGVAIGAGYAGTTTAPSDGLIVQGIAGFGTPTPTSKVEIQSDGLGAGQSNTSGLTLNNGTAATAILNQNSPAIRMRGRGWKTDATAASQAVDFRHYVTTITGTAATSGRLDFEASINGAAYNNVLAIKSDGAVGIGNTDPQRKLHVTGEARITDLTTDAPTLFVGADSDGDLGAITPGYGLTLSSGTARVDTTALKSQYLPLNLTGTTTVNTAGQQLWFRDSGDYPYTFMNSNYWIAVSDINTYMDVGSTSGTLTGNSATRMYLASAGTWEAQAASELRLDADSIVIDGTLPVNTNATSVLVRDAVTQRLEEKAIADVGTWLKPELEAGDVDIDAVGNILSITDTGTGSDMQITTDGIYQNGSGIGLQLGAIDSDVTTTADYTQIVNNNAAIGGIIRLREGTTNGANYVTLQSPTSLSTNPNFTFPTSNGTSGYFLQTNGSGVTSWATPTWLKTQLEGGTNVSINTASSAGLTINDAGYISLSANATGGTEPDDYGYLDVTDDGANAVSAQMFVDNQSKGMGSIRLDHQVQGIDVAGDTAVVDLNYLVSSGTDLTHRIAFMKGKELRMNSDWDIQLNAADEIIFNGETHQYNIVSHSAAPSLAITNAGSGATITGYSSENSSVSGRFTFTTGTGSLTGGNTVQVTFSAITFPQVPIVQIQADATKDTNGGLAAAVLIGAGKCVPIATTTNFTLYIDATGLANSTRYDFTYTVSSAN
jgi:hypothetical protein